MQNSDFIIQVLQFFLEIFSFFIIRLLLNPHFIEREGKNDGVEEDFVEELDTFIQSDIITEWLYKNIVGYFDFEEFFINSCLHSIVKVSQSDKEDLEELVEIAFIAIVVSLSVVDERPTEGTNDKGEDLDKGQHLKYFRFFYRLCIY